MSKWVITTKNGNGVFLSGKAKENGYAEMLRTPTYFPTSRDAKQALILSPIKELKNWEIKEMK